MNSASNENSNPELTSEPEDFETVNLSDVLPDKDSESEGKDSESKGNSEKKSLQLMAAEYEKDPFSSQRTIFYVISSILLLGIVFWLVRKIWL
ncbi:hypothetical protein [Niallia endozanthoxylica]|uniref:hypothetical protein n=1 Tax=Niallia endozanthoxylica TaxID=2036016 RepID=UPI00168B844A|nr:hypothetical protein [Niallia endozanthoxylica]